MNPNHVGAALRSLAVEWRASAAELRTWGADGNAATLEHAADQLERALAEGDGQRLTLEDAAELSGYSSDHLRRLARDGKLAHVRDGRRLYFRAGDLPRRSPRVDVPDIAAYDADADARQVARLRAQGGS